MGEQFFDDLARGLDDGTISRRRALQLFGTAALGAALMPLMPEQAEALTRTARRRCRHQGASHWRRAIAIAQLSAPVTSASFIARAIRTARALRRCPAA